MISKILLGLAALIAIFLAVVAMQPTDFRITRSATIPAPISVVFEEVSNLHKWQTWSPWARMDPAAKVTFEGPDTGIRSAFTWSGNEKVGEGRMTVTELEPEESVRFLLEFKRPFVGANSAEFTFRADGPQTQVQWSMSGTNNFMAKAYSLFVDRDKMVGDEFEKGFKNLTEVCQPAAS